jgi:hypothetical protein
MKIKWAVASLALGGILAGFGTGVGVGVIWAGPALIKAHCFVAEPRGITWAVHKAGICDGMVDASRGIHMELIRLRGHLNTRSGVPVQEQLQSGAAQPRARVGDRGFTERGRRAFTSPP